MGLSRGSFGVNHPFEPIGLSQMYVCIPSSGGMLLIFPLYLTLFSWERGEVEAVAEASHHPATEGRTRVSKNAGGAARL